MKRSGDREVCAYAPRLWNELPDNIKAADSVQNFREQLRTFQKELIRPHVYGPRLWNELPVNIKAADSVQNFKEQLETLLFQEELI